MVTVLSPDKLAATIGTTVTAGLDRFEQVLPAIPAQLFRLQRTIAGTTYDRYVSTVKAVTDSTKSVLDVAFVSGKTATGQARAASDDVARSARTGVNTVVGQARAATTRFADTARTNARTVGGQVAAQGRKVTAQADRQATGLIDAAIESVEGDVDAAVSGAEKATRKAAATTNGTSRKPATSRKAATKTPRKVSTAATATSGSGTTYEQRTKAELLERAQELNIDGRSQMSKDELIAALRAS